MYRKEFVYPSGADWIDAIGVEPRAAGDDETVRELRWSAGSSGELEIVFDLLGNSVRCRWWRSAELIVDIFRESARQVSVGSGSGEAHLSIIFESEGLKGMLTLKLLPDIRLDDNLLFK